MIETNTNTNACAERLRGLLGLQEAILGEDLASLSRMPETARIERYGQLARDEDEFVFEYPRDCDGQLTSAERDEVRSRFRLARLFIYASFANQSRPVPTDLSGDFDPVEVEAVIDFEQYKSFDALTEAQIEERIRRMDGEIYTLVKQYTSTQLEDLDALLEDPTVQGDVLKQLVDRYDTRLKKIRRAVELYVRIHGPERPVEAIEAALGTVLSSAEEREEIRETVRREVEAVADDLDRTLAGRQQEVDAALRTFEAELDAARETPEAVRTELAALRSRATDLERAHDTVLSEVAARIERAQGLDDRLADRIAELETARREAEAERGALTAETVELVERELAALRAEHGDVTASIDALRSERQRVEDARDRLDERQAELESRVEGLSSTLETTLDGDDVVTTAMARLFELDYLGRFDIRMHEAPSVTTPEGEVEVTDHTWEDAVVRRDSVSTLRERLPAGADVDSYPANRRVRFELGHSRYLGMSRRLRVVFEASVVSHLEAYALNGFDVRPATIDDLLGAVNRAVREADAGGFHYLLALASPTGWTDDVRARLLDETFSRTRFSRLLHVCLVDLQDGSLVYDAADELLAANRRLFEPSLDAERLADCVATIRERADEPGTMNVRLDTLVEEGFPAHVVKRAFNRLEGERVGQQRLLDEFGLVLTFE